MVWFALFLKSVIFNLRKKFKISRSYKRLIVLTLNLTYKGKSSFLPYLAAALMYKEHVFKRRLILGDI